MMADMSDTLANLEKKSGEPSTKLGATNTGKDLVFKCGCGGEIGADQNFCGMCGKKAMVAAICINYSNYCASCGID